MNLGPPRRPPLLPYDGDEEEHTQPHHRAAMSMPERLVRVETKVDRHATDMKKILHDLQDVSTGLQGASSDLKSLIERRRFHDKLILGAATLIVTGLLVALLRISWLVQSAKFP